jgi:hypothetical protein
VTTQPPDFDQLIGSDVEASERARLRRVHSLLVQAGPPPELSPSLEAGPTLAMTMARRPARMRRRVLLLAATVAILGLAFLAGFVAGNSGNGTSAGKVMQLTGTPAAPNAFASLRLEPVDAAGNWPMELSVKGLPVLADGQYYEVYLVRGGKQLAPCGSFRVANGRPTVVQLNAPYRLEHGDSWDVLRMRNGKPETGVVVLRPV